METSDDESDGSSVVITMVSVVKDDSWEVVDGSPEAGQGGNDWTAILGPF